MWKNFKFVCLKYSVNFGIRNLLLFIEGMIVDIYLLSVLKFLCIGKNIYYKFLYEIKLLEFK